MRHHILNIITIYRQSHKKMRHAIKTYHPLTLPVTAACMLFVVICSPFAPFAVNDCYFRLYPLALSMALVSIALWGISLKHAKKTFRFHLSDWLITLGVACYLLRYDYSLHLADWKILYAVLLWIFWFEARWTASVCSDIRKIVPTFTSLLCCFLVCWGLLQLYGWAKPIHVHFRITGPFFNPGPYSGYLAMMLPVCLHGFFRSCGWLRYLHLLAVLLTFSILPAAMSRSAWIALAIGITWVVCMEKRAWQRLQTCFKNGRMKMWAFVGIALGILVAAGFALFFLKADSAYGRLLIWNNSFHAFAERPLAGYGAGSFPAVAGNAQAAYFTSGEASALAERVAGQVEYAFNDYLQLLIEGGILLLAFFLAWGIVVFRSGKSARSYGYVGALLAFAVFAFSSYPLQILPFGLAVVAFGAFCVSAPPSSVETRTGKSWRTRILLAGLCIGGICSVWKLHTLPEVYRQWQVADLLWKQSVYDVAAKEYARLFPQLNAHSTFLRRYASALFEDGRTLEACRVLDREKQISCDPMIWNTQGRYYQSAGRYAEAEACFKHALLLAPNRLYPYYLLAKLYSEEKFFHKDQALKMIRIVLTKPPKVESKAADEMRIEMDALYNQLNH